MFRFLLGIAVGMAAATAMQRKKEFTRPSAVRGGVGRVDELSAAAERPFENTELNAGDGTPSQGATRAASGSASPSGEYRDQDKGRVPAIGETSDTFNAA
jgi:hypothetical protein